MSAAANPNNLDPRQMSADDRSDLEVEEILNEIGIFSNDDFGNGLWSDEPGLPTTSFNSSLLAPVSPDHQTAFSENADHGMKTGGMVTPSSSTHSFSVPNPMAPMTQFSILPASAAVTMPQRDTKSVKQSIKTTKGRTSKLRKRKQPEASATRASKTVVLPKVPSDTSSMLFPKSKEEGFTEEELEERRQRNREHAKRSRQRKKSLTRTLQQSVDVLKEENTKLREQIFAAIGPQKTNAILETQKAKSQAYFMSCLMQPANRALDENAIAFFRDLRKHLPAPATATSIPAKKLRRT